MPLGFCLVDAEDRIRVANTRLYEIWGLPPHLRVPGLAFADFMAATRPIEVAHPESPPRPLGTVGRRRREYVLPDGRILEVFVDRGADGVCVATHEDVTERRRNEARIAHLARHDPLTGLVNRAVFGETLDAALEATRDGAEPVAVLCLDLDRFKAVNDTLGHPAGDALLVAVARRLRGCCREDDAVARLGGDEFAVVQRGGPQPATAEATGRRIIEALSRPYDLEGRSVTVGASVGVAIVDAGARARDRQELLRRADLALYRAKAACRGTLAFYGPDVEPRRAA